MPKSPFLQNRPSITAARQGFPVVRYAFGSGIKERTTSYGSSYRYGFNKQEKDGEMGDYYAFEYRVQDARIGRFLSVDPLSSEYPWNSTFAFAENSVIKYIDLEGLEKAEPEDYQNSVEYLKNIRNEYTGYWTLEFLVNEAGSEMMDNKAQMIWHPATRKNETVFGEHDNSDNSYSGIKMTDLIDELIQKYSNYDSKSSTLNNDDANTFTCGKYAWDNLIKNIDPLNYAKLILNISENGAGSFNNANGILYADKSEVYTSPNICSQIFIASLAKATLNYNSLFYLGRMTGLGGLRKESTFPHEMEFIGEVYFNLIMQSGKHYLIGQSADFSKRKFTNADISKLNMLTNENMAIMFDDHVISYETNNTSAGKYGYHFTTLHSFEFDENMNQFKLTFYSAGKIVSKSVPYEDFMGHLMGYWIFTK